MKYLKQFGIILSISFLGELLSRVLPLPIPASIYGLVLLLLGLRTGLIPCGAVRETAVFLIEIMPLLFIPAAVGLLESWNVLRPVLVPFLVISVCSTFLVLLASGRVTQAILRKRGGGAES